MKGTYQPVLYLDTYAQWLQEAIQSKIQCKLYRSKISAIDLMEALQRSLAQMQGLKPSKQRR